MSRDYFMTSARVGFSEWTEADAELARRLWCSPEVTRYICATGMFTDEEVLARLQTEIENGKQHQMQYWPIFRLEDGDFIGCCGLRPHEPRRPELGFHLLPKYWRQGYASEAARRAMDYALERFDIDGLNAGHHPENGASEHVLKRLGFVCVGTEYYPPTRLMHPSYRYDRNGTGRSSMIRTMTIGDYESVYALWLSCTGMGLTNLDDSEEGVARFLQRNPDTCFICEEDSRIVGVILAGQDGRRGYIYHTAVHPDFRHRGIAAALVSAALEALKRAGIHKVALVAFERNAEGNAFWEAQGFSPREDLVYRDRVLTEMTRIDT